MAPNAEQLANDVLAGRVRLGAGELLDCIHEINPTGRALGTADERRRYQLKARLQSLLIRSFPDDLVMSAEGGDVVAIRHRYLGQDACHARVDELDDDARARVRWLLDTGETDAPDEPASAAPSAPAAADLDLIAQGRAALDEFDYDTARQRFERAALHATDDPAAARALLELLVDHLALDEEALGIERQLAPRIAADSEVRGLLAVAAARLGDAGAVARLLDGLAGTRVADAWAALAQHAVEHQAGDDVDRFIARLTECDPARPELVGLREAANRLRADARRPAEQELLRLAEQDDAAAEATARALLARWPDSAVAGKVLGRIQERRRAGDAERLLAQARSALSSGDPARAMELCRQARGVGAEVQDLVDQIRAAEAAQRRARDDAEVAAVCARLAEPDLRPGLAAFLALEPELRSRVRARIDLPVLDWLEQAAGRHKAARQGALSDAVLAIAAAAEAAARGDDDRVLALLDPHEALLGGVSRASELHGEAQRRISARRRAAATSALEQARLALAAGDLDGYERASEPLDRRDLDAAQRQQLDELRSEVHARRDALRRGARIDELAAAGDLVTAVRELEDLLARSPAEQDAMHARLDGLRAELRRAWCARTDQVEALRGDHDRIGELLGPLPYMESAAPWLVAEGRELVIATADGPHVFVARVSVDDARLIDRRCLRAPEPIGPLLTTIVDGDTIWLVGQAGRVLQLRWTTGEPRRWASLASFLVGDERIDRVYVIPGGSHLWVEAEVPAAGSTFRVIDIEGWRVRRELPAARTFQLLVAGVASSIIGMRYDGGALRYTDRGTVAEELSAVAGMQVSAVTGDAGGGLIVLGARSEDDGEIEIVHLRGGRVLHRWTLPESWHERSHRCASARRSGLVAVHHIVEVGDARLAVLRSSESELAPVYTVHAPSDVVLAQDVDAGEVVALWDSAQGVRLARIAAEPPVFGDAVALHPRWVLPALTDYFSCGPHGDDANTGRLYAAEQDARRGDWQKARTALETTAPDSVAPEWRAHHYHLLGLAWLHTGIEPERVRDLWQTGQSHEPGDDVRLFSCRLDVCLDLVEPPPDPLPADWWDAGAPLIRQLRGAIATADRHQAAGDARTALDTLRRRVVTHSGELQSTARLAAAWLAIDAEAPDGFDKAIALARFVALHLRGAVDLPIAGAWSADRLADIADQAQRWLATWHEQR